MTTFNTVIWWAWAGLVAVGVCAAVASGLWVLEGLIRYAARVCRPAASIAEAVDELDAAEADWAAWDALPEPSFRRHPRAWFRWWMGGHRTSNRKTWARVDLYLAAAAEQAREVDR